MAIRRFEEIVAWQRARDLSIAVYQITSAGDFARDFGLRDQIRRASVSVMSNIAEGFDRFTRPEFARFLSISRGSAAEVRSQLYIAHALGYLRQEEFDRLYQLSLEVSRLVTSLRSSISRT